MPNLFRNLIQFGGQRIEPLDHIILGLLASFTRDVRRHLGREQAGEGYPDHHHHDRHKPPAFSRAEARRGWAELLRLIYEVDLLRCPASGGEMRVIALIQEPAVIDNLTRSDGPAHTWPGVRELVRSSVSMQSTTIWFSAIRLRVNV